MLALALTLLLAQPDTRSPVGVVLTSRRANTDAFAPKIAAKVGEVLKREGVAEVLDDTRTSKELKAAGFSDPRTCNGGATCSARLAVLLGPRAILVGVDIGKVGKSLAIHLEAFAGDLAEPIAVADISAREDKWQDQSLADVTAFARQVKERLPITKVAARPVERPAEPKPRVEPKPVDAPRERPLEPSPEPSDEQRLDEVATPSKVPAIAVASAAGATAVVTVVFGILTAIDRGTWDRNVMMTDTGLSAPGLLGSEVNSLGQSINTRATITLVGALVTAGLGGLATWLFLK